jgi:hypothetical protein
MTFGALMIHPLAIVTPVSTASDDTYGQPIAGTPRTVQVRGMVQPRTAREMALVNQGGAEFADYTIFLPPMHVSGAAYIRDDPDTGRRFQIVGVRSYEFGSAPHLEVDARLVGSTEGPTVPGS